MPHDLLDPWCVDSGNGSSEGPELPLHNSVLRKYFLSQNNSYRRDESEGVGLFPSGDDACCSELEISILFFEPLRREGKRHVGADSGKAFRSSS